MFSRTATSLLLAEMPNGGRKFFSVNRPDDNYPGPATILVANGNAGPLIERAKPLCERERAAPASGAATGGTFRLLTSRDPMTDVVTTTVVTRSATGPETLAWSCANNELTVGFDFQRVLSISGSLVVVTYRFPPDPPSTIWWQRAVGNRTMAVESGADARSFTETAPKSKTVIMRANDSQDIITAEFSLNGLAEALKQLPCARAIPKQ